ncbi:WD40 repeat domain-containing protein [Candidatus Bathyarchaeota archaeon]|nr:WD40 repeat domain-containing protein [Candidatus Bathyarchaeota archaeon]
MNRRTILALFVLVLLESGLAYLVFNHTARERKPTLTVLSEEDITCFDISNWGDSLAVGTSDGTISYYQRGKTLPQWVYRGSSGLASVLVSGEGDYVLAMDVNHTVYLFRSLGIGVNTPRWSQHIPDGRILGIHSSGGIPPIIYMLASVDGRILLLSDKEGLLWEYSTGTSNVAAEISYDGKYMAAVDASGRVYLFDIGEPQPIWVSSTKMTDGVLCLSQISRLAVGGGDPSGGGRVLSLALEDGEAIWEWGAASPVTSVSMSSDGSKVVVYESEGKASVLTETMGEVAERELRAAGAIKSVWSPPFGSYTIALDVEGTVYFLYGSRSAPLWVYDAGTDVVDIAVTSMGDKVFVADRSSVAVITNSIETGMIPGSRILWEIWFLVGLTGSVIVYFVAGVRLSRLKFVKVSYRVLASGFVLGGVLGFVLWRGSLEVFAAAVSCAVGCYFGSSKEGLGGFAAGLFASAAVSMGASILYGISVWFSGVESNVVVLVVTNISSGTRVGFIFGVFGIFLGFLVAKLGGTR